MRRKDIHKFTWECREINHQRSIIDYFRVKREMKSQLKDVKVVSGVEIGSDHYLLLMTMKMQMKGNLKMLEGMEEVEGKWMMNRQVEEV